MRRSLAVLTAAVVLLLVLFPLSVCAAPEVRKMVLVKDAVSLRVGETFELKLQIAPFNADKSVTWVSTNDSVVTVNDGLLTGVSIGTAEITATSVQNPSISVTASVMVVKPVESITLEDQEIVLPKGAVWEQVAYVMPEDATMLRPVWTTSDKKVAVVDENGVITAVGNGYCTITAVSADNLGAKASARVQVRHHEAIISEPGEFTVDFEMIEDEGTDEITKGTKTIKDNWKKTVTFENERLEKVSDTSVRPLKAGSEIVHMREIHKSSGKTKITKESRHFIFIEKSAVRKAGSVPQENAEGEIRFRDIPWGVRYKEVKSFLSARKEKLKSPIERNGMLWTQISGDVYFGDFKAFRNGLSFTSSSANVENLTANLQKTSFCIGDYYFEKDIPFENLKLSVMKYYGLPDNETTSSTDECVWKSGDVTVHLFTTPKYTQLQISWQDPAKKEKPGAEQDGETEEDGTEAETESETESETGTEADSEPESGTEEFD